MDLKKLKKPIFLPDATRGVAKILSSEDLKRAGTSGLVVNTYHLFLQPGTEIIKKAGGIHKFMDWDGFIMSDSGGYQIFSLIHKNSNMGKITDEKAVFKSPLNGSKMEMTPEKSIKIQFDLGVDAMVCLDDCPPNNYNEQAIAKAVERTILWADRCAREYERNLKRRKIINTTPLTPLVRGAKAKRPLIFAVIQGGPYLHLRKKCIEGLLEVAPKTGWDGFGFGARHIDKDGKLMEQVLKYTADLIPKNKLLFALGIGTPDDIIKCSTMGWDMFDCVIPTREGRHGRLFFWGKNNKIQNTRHKTQKNSKLKLQNNFYNTINITNAKFSRDFSAINKNSKLPELKNYSKAYLHHLFKINESLGQRLASLNNLEFYNELIKKIKVKT